MYYHRNLPHFLPDDAPYFITFRLAGSVPQTVMKRLHLDRERELKRLEEQGNISDEDRRAIHKRFFAQYDHELDHPGNGPYWLAQPPVLQCLQTQLQKLEEDQYDLWAYTIMSNHVHMLFSLKSGSKLLYEVMNLMKGRSSYECNKLLDRRGAFWQAESYDHVVRENEFGRIVSYVLLNPVKAGLVKEWCDWKGTYLNPELKGF